MKTLLQYVLLVSLAAPCRYLSAQSTNPYDLQLKEAQGELASAGELRKLALLDEIYQLREYVSDPDSALQAMRSLATDGRESATVRGEADALATKIEAERGTGKPALNRWYESEARGRILAEATGAAGNDAAGLELRAELEFAAGMPEAAEHMAQAAQLAPTAARYDRAARFASDMLHSFSALQSGLALDPGNSALNLQLANYYIGRDQLEKARDLLGHAITAHPNDFVLRERLATLYMSIGLRALAMRQLQSLEKQWPDPLWLKARLASDYEQLGLRDEAARLAESVVAVSRSNVSMLQLLARFHQSRQRLRALETDRRELAKFQPSPAPNQAFSHDGRGNSLDAAVDARFLADPEALAKTAFSRSAQDGDIALADIRVQELYAGGMDRVHIQHIFLASSEPAAEAHRITSIRYSPSREALHVVHARVWKRTGGTLDAQDLGDHEQADTSAPIHYDYRTRLLRFGNIEAGDVVEIEYSLLPLEHTSPYGPYFGELVFFAGAANTELKRYVLIAPSDQTIYAHAEKVAPATVLVQGESKMRVWEARNVPRIVREAHSPGLSENAPYVHVSTFADWQQLGSWYADLIRPQFALDTTLQQQLAALLQGKRNDREKIAAIQEFVLRSTHYVAQEFGVYSYKPYPVAQTYARRYGDCKDKASLIIALLRAAGIEAQLALVRTRSLGSVATEPASVALFDHAIVYIPKYDSWLDGTAEYAVRELPLEDQGALTLTVGLDGASELLRTPMSRAADNYTKHVIQAQLTAKGGISFSGSTIARGEDAPGLRQELTSGEQQLDSVRRDLERVFPTVQVYSVHVQDGRWAAGETANSEISIEFRGGVNPVHRKHTAALSTSWIPRTYAAALAPSGSRTQDLLLFAPWTTEEEIHIALPVGARIPVMPRDRILITPFGSLKLQFRKAAQELLIQSHVEFDAERIAARDYPAFREFCLQAEQIFREELKVELPQ